MGIRINKQLGWLLEGVDLDLTKLGGMTLLDLKNQNSNDYELCNLDLMYPDLNLKVKLSTFITDLTDEYQENPVPKFMFTPPYVGRNWLRTGDAIDLYDQGDAITETKIKTVHSSIFPYSKEFVVSSSLEVLTEKELQLCQIFSETPEMINKSFSKALTKKGIDLKRPISDQIHMTCPQVLKLILEKCGVNDFKKLKPSIAVYWK